MDPNPQSSVPEGALLEALNVIHRRAGMLEIRPGFPDSVALLSKPTGSIKQIIPFASDAIIFSKNGSTWQTHIRSTLASKTGVLAPPDELTYKPHCAEGRKNLYYASGEGLQKSTSAAGAWSRAGLDPVTIHVVDAGTGSTGIAANTAVAYRAVIRRTDASGYIIRSAPSGRAVYRNTAAAIHRLYHVSLGP
jgi:hypothetical protein